jgi:hypothetical protein
MPDPMITLNGEWPPASFYGTLLRADHGWVDESMLLIEWEKAPGVKATNFFRCKVGRILLDYLVGKQMRFFIKPDWMIEEIVLESL